MPLYQRKILSTDEAVGAVDVLPVHLRGLGNDVLADLAPMGLPDVGYFPVEEEEAPVRWVHKAIFKRRLTQAERIAIRDAETDEGRTDEERKALADFRDLLDSADLVFLDDPDLAAGLAFLVSLGLLTSERPAEIVA